MKSLTVKTIEELIAAWVRVLIDFVRVGEITIVPLGYITVEHVEAVQTHPVYGIRTSRSM